MLRVIFLITLAFSLQLLAPDHPFNRDISCLDPVDNSDDIIEAIGEWGFGNSDTTFRIGRDLVLGEVGPTTVWANFVEKGDYFDGECDAGVTVFPLPTNSAIEGRKTANDYTCDGGDCHILTIDRANGTIWEGFSCNQNAPGADLACTCVVKWYICGDYPYNQRGTDCTSADAAGFSVAALTLTPKEVAEDDINHALRFILNNDQIRDNVYGYPCTHSTSATSGGPNTPWYGARLRLRADFDESTFLPAAQRILRALKRYGMFLSDGGNIPLTFVDDFNFAEKWDDLLGVGGGNPDESLYGVSVFDFEVMPTEENRPLVEYSSTCVLTDVSNDGTCGEILSGLTSGECTGGDGDGSGGSSSSASFLNSIFNF